MRFFRTLSRYKTTRTYKEIKAVVPLKRETGGGGGDVCHVEGAGMSSADFNESLPGETYIIPFRI